MEVDELVHSMAVKARAAAARTRRLTTDGKNAILVGIADALDGAREAICAANAEDVAAAKSSGLAPAMVDRLTLTKSRFDSMVDGVRHVATLPDPVGEIVWERERPSGITIRKVREPFGVGDAGGHGEHDAGPFGVREGAREEGAGRAGQGRNADGPGGEKPRGCELRCEVPERIFHGLARL